jgi:hypothetical protein
VNPAENLAAFTADDYLSKDVVAAEGSGLSVRVPFQAVIYYHHRVVQSAEKCRTAGFCGSQKCVS